MFANLTIDLRMGNKPQNLGFICERLVYYSTVNIYIDCQQITRMVSEFGVQNLLYLLQEGLLTLSFEDSIYLHVSIEKDGETEENSKYRSLIPDSQVLYGGEQNPLSWEERILSSLTN